MRTSHRLTLAALTSAALVTAGASSALGAPPSPPPPATPVVVVDGLVGPLSFDVTTRGDLYVGQSFLGVLTHVTKDGERHDVLTTDSGTIGAVSERAGTLTWAERTDEDFVVTSSVLVRRAPDGTTTEVDLLAYEAAENPDAVNTYGIEGLSAECAATIPEPIAPFVLPYEGMVDSNPYATETVGSTTYVADAGANAIFAVSDDGEVSTVAVLPAIPIELTAEGAAAMGLDACVVGLTYWAEPVPTDVEVGPGGMLYVTALPGGAEDDSLGANGAVFRIDPMSGDVEMVAGGFLGATNLAVAPNGTVYVTELFAGRLSAISRSGDVSTVAELDQPAAVEWAKGRLYVSTQVFGNGSIVSLVPLR